MKDFGSDKKPLSFDQYDAQSPKPNQTSPNADIEYLLSYITLDQSQQLNLTQNFLKQQSDPHTISNQTLCKYITRNSNPEAGSSTQKQTLISIIDLGINLISGIKKLMHKRKLDQQKNKSSLSPLQMFKQLFFGRQVLAQGSEYGGDQFGKRKLGDVMMEELRMKTQSEVLLGRVQENDENGENGKFLGKHEFLLTKSLKERVQQCVKDQKLQQYIQVKIRELDKLLNCLEEYKEKNNSCAIQSEEYKKKLTEIWYLIEAISANF